MMAVPEGLGLGGFNALPVAEAEQALLPCCSSPRWAAAVAAGRPFSSAEALYAAADTALGALGEDDLDDCLAGHPRIGDRVDGSGGAWSRREQSGVTGSETVAALRAGNEAYEQRFGHVYLVCASGRTGEQLLATLRSRLDNDPATERHVVRDELAKINRIRLGRLVSGASA